MTELNFKLEELNFEGPLHLLLELIRKNNQRIFDFEITVILDQFLGYLERMAESDIEVLSDFLEMAARLILIKSSALLPKEEAEKIRQELTGALIELALAQTMAKRLKKRFRGDTVYVREPLEIELDTVYRGNHLPEELLLAYGAFSERTRKKAEYSRAPAPPPVLETHYVTVFTGVFAILKSLRQSDVVELSELYKDQPRSRKVAMFLAILELSKDGRISISEDGRRIQLTVDSKQ